MQQYALAGRFVILGTVGEDNRPEEEEEEEEEGERTEAESGLLYKADDDWETREEAEEREICMTMSSFGTRSEPESCARVGDEVGVGARVDDGDDDDGTTTATTSEDTRPAEGLSRRKNS